MSDGIVSIGMEYLRFKVEMASWRQFEDSLEGFSVSADSLFMLLRSDAVGGVVADRLIQAIDECLPVKFRSYGAGGILAPKTVTDWVNLTRAVTHLCPVTDMFRSVLVIDRIRLIRYFENVKRRDLEAVRRSDRLNKLGR